MQTNPAVAYRRRLIHSMLALPPAGVPIRLLDIGCGEGSFAALLHTLRPDVAIAGVDSSVTGLEIAARLVPDGRFFRADLLKAEPSTSVHLEGWATHAVCSEVLEHVDDPRAFLRQAARFLCDGAVLVVTVPSGPMSALDRHLGHRRHYTRRMLAGELRDTGFIVDRIWRAGFPFHNVYRLAVVMRGEAITNDARGRTTGRTGIMIQTAMRLFDRLFRLNLSSTPFGWQIVGRAVWPGRIANQALPRLEGREA